MQKSLEFQISLESTERNTSTARTKIDRDVKII